MKRLIKRFMPQTVLIVLVTVFTVAAVSVFAAVNGSTDNKVDLSLVMTPETQLTVYVDGALSGELSREYSFGDTASITAPSVSGKVFSHWEADGSIISYSNPLKLTMNAHTTLYAVYTSTTETEKPVSGFTSITRTNEGDKISFQAIAGGGTVEDAGIVYSTTASGETLKIGGTGVTNVAAVKSADLGNKLPDSVLDDNNCWMLQITPDGDSTVYHARTYVKIGSETTYGDIKDVKLSNLESGISLVADPDSMNPEDGQGIDSQDIKSLLANVKVYSVSFDANGGTGTMAPQGVQGGEATELNTNTFTREGYTFSGWSTTPTGSVAYTDGASVTLNADTTLYAQWKKSGGSGDTTPGSTTPTNTPDGTTTPTASTDKVTSAEKAKAKIKLNAGFKVSQTGKKVTVKWGKVSGADRYVVYAAYCNLGKCKKVGTLSGSKTSMTFTKLNGSKLNLKKNMKVYVVAYRKVNGKETKLARSITAHIVGSKNAKYTNVKKIKLSKSKYTLKANKTATIKAKIVLVDKKKKQLSDSHAPEFRYASSNTKVATVDKNGKITAVKKGTCYIYVYAKNGYAKKIKVVVK